MSVEIVNRAGGKKISVTRVKRTARRILALLDQQRTELSLALVGNEEIQELNSRYRHRPRPTDVLSFPAGEPMGGSSRLLGDVVISVEQAEKQSKAGPKRGERRLEEEIDRLLIHGILHLLGYDHERSKKEAQIMRAMERKISRALCGKKALAV